MKRKKQKPAPGVQSGEHPTRTQSNYLKCVQALTEAETDLTRAQNRWQKLRKQKARYEKRLDADFIRRSGGFGGSLDWRELAADVIKHDGEFPDDITGGE